MAKILLARRVTPQPPSGAIIINSDWLSTAGNPPYGLTTDGATYWFETDVATPGTAFTLKCDDATLDLNGHTITFDTEPEVVVANRSFESGNAGVPTDWDLSGAAGVACARYNHTPTDGNAKLADGDWSLGVDWSLMTNGQVATVVSNQQYTLKGGHVWRIGGYGNLAWQDTAEDSFEIRIKFGTATAKLLMGSYRPPVMFSPDGNRNNSEFGALLDLSSSGDVTDNVTIEFHRVSDPPAVGDTFAYVDYITLAPEKCVGIYCSKSSGSTDAWDVSQSTVLNSANLKIRNGTIQQGSGHAIKSRCISRPGAGTRIENVGIHCTGLHDSHAVHANFGSNVTLESCNISSSCRFQYNRDNATAAATLFANSSDMTVNGCTYDAQPGVAIGVTNGQDNAFTNNVIKHRSYYTNGFAIWSFSCDNTTVTGNTVESHEAPYGGRGFFFGSGHGQVTCTGNTVRVHENDRNMETAATEPGAFAFALQLESASGTSPAWTVTGNNFYAYARDVRAVACRLHMGNSTPAGTVIEGNEFHAISDTSTLESYLFLIWDFDADNYSFKDNKLYGNSCIWFGRNDGAPAGPMRVRECEFIDSGSAAHQPAAGMLQEWPESNPSQLEFIDPTWTSTYYRDIVRTECVHYLVPGGVCSANSWTDLLWSLTITVEDSVSSNPITGATVTITDDSQSDLQVFQGTTDGTGQVIPDLAELHSATDGSRVHSVATRGPYTITTTASGYNQDQRAHATPTAAGTLTIPLVSS